MAQHRLAYLLSPKVVGADSLVNISTLTPCVIEPLDVAMRRAHHTDAHFVCYNLRDSQEWPRLKKVCLPHILQAGDAVLMPYIAIDIDNPGHEPWDLPKCSWCGYEHEGGPENCSAAEKVQPQSGIEKVSNFLDLIQAFSDYWWPAAKWSYLYTTRAGVRIFYTLTEPLSPEDWELCTRRLIAEFKAQNFDVDPACKDWTRIFRLPDVMRDGQQQGTQPTFVLCEEPDRRLDASTRFRDLTVDFDSVFPRKQPEEALDLQPVGNQPDMEDAYALLHRRVGNKEVFTEWYKNARKALVGQPYFPALFESQPLAAQGDRDNALLKTTGSVISILHGRFGTTINHVYGLLLEAVEGFDPDVGTPDWEKATWGKVQMIWAKEDAKQRAKTAKEKESLQAQYNHVDQMAAGMREWCDHSVLHSDDRDKVHEFVYRHLIAVGGAGRELHILRPDGYYDVVSCSAQNVVARFRAVHGDDLLDLRIQTQKNRYRWAKPEELINGNGTVIGEVSLQANKVRGGTIDAIDTDLASLRISQFSRSTTLAPIYDPQVDKWLHLLFDRNYDAGIRWIAWALAFEEGPICALSVCGPTGVGKTLLVEGLKETLTTPCASDFSELVGEWQYNLSISPFVLTDEGVDHSYNKAHPADVFRRLVGRSNIKAKQKYRAPVNIQTDVRIVFTGNNHHLIRMLVSEQDGFSPADREALMIRLLHFDTGPEAADWLASQGGRRFTDQWISDGKTSQYIVAQHFLWLYEQRNQLGKDDRLLVEGNLTTAVLNELRLHSKDTDLVLEAIAFMVDAADDSIRKGDTHVDGDSIWVIPNDVHKYIHKHLGFRLSISQVRDRLGSLLPKDARDSKGQVKVKSIEGDRRRRYPVDITFLKETCYEYGWPTTRLEVSPGPQFPVQSLKDQTDDAPRFKFRLAK